MNRLEPRAPVFPARPPPSLTDPAVIRAHDWKAFSRVPSLTDHWARPGWRTGRRSYHWLITFEEEPALAALARRCQQAIDHLALDPVPVDGLHLTLARLGFTDELGPQEASAIARASVAHCRDLPTFSLTIGPVAGSRGAIRFTVTPWDRLVEARRRLRVAANEALDRDWGGGAADAFRPHVSIAYSNRNLPTAPVVRAVTPLRQLAPIEVSVRSLSLVVLRRESEVYRWQRHTIIPLEGPP